MGTKTTWKKQVSIAKKKFSTVYFLANIPKAILSKLKTNLANYSHFNFFLDNFHPLLLNQTLMMKTYPSLLLDRYIQSHLYFFEDFMLTVNSITFLFTINHFLVTAIVYTEDSVSSFSSDEEIILPNKYSQHSPTLSHPSCLLPDRDSVFQSFLIVPSQDDSADDAQCALHTVTMN